MKAETLKNILGAEFYTGVPDSLLNALCNCLVEEYGISNQHIIAANEGNAAALAAGCYLSTGKIPVVYLQNSGIGNLINPAASLLHPKVYGIPCIFVVGWRGEPGVKDEPQHLFQGEITQKLLEDMEIPYVVIDSTTTVENLLEKWSGFKKLLNNGRSVAIVVRKAALQHEDKPAVPNGYPMIREEVIAHITEVSREDIVVSTTGKASRELFEIREKKGQGHQYDFLTVGSMGHSSSIALGIALNKPGTRVWCIDGDGAALMHMGSMAVIGSSRPKNLIHIIINNGTHETVGKMPTVAQNMDFIKIAEGCGYEYACTVSDYETLDQDLQKAAALQCLTLIEVKCASSSRADLGRPTATPQENKQVFMKYLNTLH